MPNYSYEDMQNMQKTTFDKIQRNTLAALQGSAISSKSNKTYHGDFLRVDYKDSEDGNSFNYFLNQNNTWVEISRSHAIHELFKHQIYSDSFIIQHEDNGKSQAVIFEPEQIHILGSQQDIEGFKRFVNRESVSSFTPIYDSNNITTKLDKFLISYIKNFGVSTFVINNFKERFGLDSSGAVDVIQKVIFLNKNKMTSETIREEVSHMVVMLMGESPEIKTLLSNIESWDEYKSIYNKYFPIYKNEKKVKVEAIGQLVSKAIQMEYASNNPIEKTLFEKIKEWLLKFIGKYKDLSKYEYFPLAQQIASNVLSGDESFIRKNESRKISNLDYDKSLNNTPLAKYVFDMVAENFPMAKLTGSLALSKQVNIERFSNMPIHDLDYVISCFISTSFQVLPYSSVTSLIG